MEHRLRNIYSFKFLVFLLLIVLLAGYAYSQTTGKITGIVTTAEDGEPLAGANVIVVDTYLGAAADMDGYFTIVNVPPGVYEVQVTMMGYQKTTKTNVKVLDTEKGKVSESLTGPTN